MKLSISVLLLFLATGLRAQKDVTGMISAEKNFAAWSVKNGTRDAFLHFLDSNGIIFEKGNPVNGLNSWSKQKDGPGTLNWQPELAETAASGDFGYTSGPWTFTNHDSVKARGQFITIWHCDHTGTWKFLVDLGVHYTYEQPTPGSVRIIKSRHQSTVLPDKDLRNTEEAFIKTCREHPLKAYEEYLSEQSVLNRDNYLPASKPTEKKMITGATPVGIQYEPKGSGMASSGDLGYVYGTLTINNKNGSYLRIWRRENKGWSIAMEVVRY